jgi:hypothetical protein
MEIEVWLILCHVDCPGDEDDSILGSGIEVELILSMEIEVWLILCHVDCPGDEDDSIL